MQIARTLWEDIILWPTMDKNAKALPMVFSAFGAASTNMESEIDRALSMLRR